MSKNCWLCPQVFENKRDLKVHMTARPHARMSVVCPWCFHEKTFNRVIDLRSHATNNHRSQLFNLPSNFLGENNGFWLSLYPDDYRRLVNPTDRFSESAAKARELILKWSRQCTRRTRSRADWLDGWQEPSRASLLDEERDSFVPDYETEILDELDKADDDVPVYKPTPTATLLNISLVPGQITADFKRDNETVRTEISDDLFKDQRSMASIARRMAVLKDSNFGGEAQTFEAVSGEPAEQLRAQASQLLGIPISLIRKVLKAATITRPAVPRKEPSSTLSSPNITLHLPQEIAESPRNLQPDFPAATVTPQKSQLTTRDPHNPVRAKKHLQSSVATVKTAKKADEDPFNIRRRAKQLLAIGCMPLFPPARRDWQRDQVVKLNVGTVELMWPPKSWDSMTADQKLLQWEYASMRLETAANKDQTPLVDRLALLDRYNFLALPGTATYNIRKVDEKIAKARYYTYEHLREIATGKVVINSETEQWMKMLECGGMLRDTCVSQLIQHIEERKVKLRLE